MHQKGDQNSVNNSSKSEQDKQAVARDVHKILGPFESHSAKFILILDRKHSDFVILHISTKWLSRPS